MEIEFSNHSFGTGSSSSLALCDLSKRLLNQTNPNLGQVSEINLFLVRNPNRTQTKVNVSIGFLFPCFLRLTREATEVIWLDLELDLLPQPVGGAQRVDWSDTPPQARVVATESFYCGRGCRHSNLIASNQCGDEKHDILRVSAHQSPFDENQPSPPLA